MILFQDDQSPEKFEETNDNNIAKESELASCKNDLQQLKDNFLRLNADFDNYKKRVIKEKSTWITECQANIFQDLLNIIDDFDRAFSGYKKTEQKEIDKWIVGFELIYKEFYKFLDKFDVKEITDISVFNPELHEAIVQVKSNDHKSGEIVAVLQKGFFLKDRVLRPAKVSVAE